ncbi:hypothetical protein T12_249 [Trichinella patagoniensis]|uniref:Uncharacterized protein n=1 Tax=Trichinella patagoniensis TaxID=990121 RepID=A0A0V0ZYS3_9BILA|nr:hypothetical protein T12_249 [Trichinella patagoniensis]
MNVISELFDNENKDEILSGYISRRRYIVLDFHSKRWPHLQKKAEEELVVIVAVMAALCPCVTWFVTRLSYYSKWLRRSKEVAELRPIAVIESKIAYSSLIHRATAMKRYTLHQMIKKRLK